MLRRPEKIGLGDAYRAGFALGMDRGYEMLVQIDADLSHDPRALPGLLAAVEDGADLAIGSRYVPGGAIPHWPWLRRALSKWGNRYTNFVLGMPINDATSGFRVYRADVLRKVDYASTARRATGSRSSSRTACGGTAAGSTSSRSSSPTAYAACRR